MNRRSLFGRLAAPLARQTAQRMEHYRAQVEPLEDRKMLSITNYVDDNWVDIDAGGTAPLAIGDTVVSSADAVHNTITAVYGTDAFGHVTAASISGGPTGLTGGALIHDAIQYGLDNPGSGTTVSLLEGTYSESDIVITHTMAFKGSGQSGTTNTLIVPDIASSHTNLTEFGANTHSGIIIYAPSVTVSNLHINGSGNTPLGTLQFHQGITTLYDNQEGNSYTDLVIDATTNTKITSAAHPFSAASAGQQITITGGTGFTPGVYTVVSVSGSVATLNSSAGTLSSTGGTATGFYLAEHDASGGFLPIIQLRGTGDTTGATTQTHPRLMIQDVTVENIFYHGITLAAPGGVNYEFNSDLDGTANAVARATVTNVGDAGNKDESRIGILLLNIYGQRRFPGDHTGGNVDTCTVTDAGIGIETNAFGHKVFDHDDQGATNGSFIGNSTVNNAIKEGFHIEYMSDSDSQLSGISALFPNNLANFSGSNTATGIVINHSDILATASAVTGALIGVRVQNTGSSPGIGGAGTILATNIKLTGPGTASAGSIGILGDNTSAEPQSSALLSNRIEITNYATGVVFKQSYDPGSSLATTLVLSLPFVHGNAVGFNIGAGVTVVGNMNTTDPVFDPGTTIAPGFPAGAVDLSDSITNQQTPLSPIPGPQDGTPPTPTGKVAATGTADVIGTGNLTLGSTTTYVPKVIGNPGGQVTLQNFNSDYTFSNINVGIDGVDPWNYNGGTPYKQQALALLHSPLFTHWGPTTNGGNGYLSVGPQNGGEFGAMYSNLYNATPTNASGYTALQVVAKADPSNAAQEFQVGFIDQDGTTLLYFTTFDQLSTVSMRTITINLQSSAIRLVRGDGTMNMSAVTGFIIGGDIGLADMYSSDTFGLIVDDISFVKPLGNDQMQVTGTVNLGSSVLAPFTDTNHFTPSISQVFTILDNDGSTDTITGTFSGIAEGGKVNSSSIKYQVSYVGGNGNDVTLKRVADAGTPVLDLNGIPTPAGTGYTSTWTSGPVAITDTGAASLVDPDAEDTITQMTATITNFHTNDVLAATMPSSLSMISVSYNPTGVLTLSGTTTQANYQAALRLLTYDNTGAGPGGNVSIDIKADDGMLGSGLGSAALATVTVGGSSVIPTGGRLLFYNQSTWDGGVDTVTTSDDAAIATDKTAYIANGTSASSTALSSFNRGINGVMVDLLGGGSHTAINASDFIFKTGNDNTPSGWATASAPVLITVRTGAGVSSSDRVEILWGANAVKKAWLEVEVLNTAHTGLAATDVFYWGNMVGDSNLNFATSGADSSNVLANPTGAASISNTRDHNRSKVVNGTDSSLALANVANIVRINLSAGSMSPVGGGDGGGIGAGPAASSAGDSGIASGLSATAATASSPVHVPAWVLDRLRKLDLNSGPVADYFQYLHDQGTPQAKAILTKADRIADALHLDDHFLDSLLDDLDE